MALHGRSFRFRAFGGITFLIFVIFMRSAFPQTSTGRLVGDIYDRTGGALANARIVAVDSQTRLERTAEANGAGYFSMPLLEVGSYSIEISKPGFSSYKKNNVVIEVGREVSISAILEVAPLESSIKIDAAPLSSNGSTSEISVTVDAEQLRNLPLDGANPFGLVLLQAGTAYVNGLSPSINGLRPAITNATRDGLNIQDIFARNNASAFASGRPTVEDVQEFTITTQNADAAEELGPTQITFATPRGSSAFHGGLYEYNRNASYGANGFFNNKSGSEKPPRNRNQFGGTLSGPIPGLDNMAHFFTMYEALRDDVTAQANRTLLLPDARNGIFTYSTIVNGRNTINKVNLLNLNAAVAQIDPTIQSRLLAKMPDAGNRTDMGDQLNTTGLTFSQHDNTDRDTSTSRIDFNLNKEQALSLIFTRNKETDQRPDLNNTEGFYQNHPIILSTPNTDFTLAHRISLDSGFSNELRAGVFYSTVAFQRTTDTPGYFLSIPSSLVSNPEVSFLDQGRKTKTYMAQNNAEYLSKGHIVKFGGSVEMFHVDPYNDAGIVPTYTIGTNINTPVLSSSMFPGINSSQLTTANSLFALLGGIVSGGTQTFNLKDTSSGFSAIPRMEQYRYSNYSLYIEDQWRPARSLSLNLGLRYELLTPMRLANGIAFEPVIQAGMTPQQAVLNPNGTYDYVGRNAGGNKLYKTDWNNFAPVLGFAFSPRSDNSILKAIMGTPDSFIIRGGFRYSYALDSYLTSARYALSGNYPISNAIDASGSQLLNARLNSLPAIQAPAIPKTYLQNDGPFVNNFGTVFAIDPNIQTSRIVEYNLSIQRKLPGNTQLEIRYVGNRSDNLWRAADYNQIDIRNNGFADDFNRARRNYLANNNPAVGEPLQVFPLLAQGGQLSKSFVQSQLLNGTPADLALIYIQGNQEGSVNFQPNPNIGAAYVLCNCAMHRYNSLQIEVRKQFGSRLSFQANYTLQKTLTNAIGTSQSLADNYLDLENPSLEYTRADFDISHVFNANWIYALPFGKERNLGRNLPAWANALISNWQLSGIARISSGSPITIVDPRGTLNRAARSSRQTADTALTTDQLRALTGHFENSKGIYFINPSVLDSEGRAAEGLGKTFQGQELFNAAPGATGSMGRALINGPAYFNIDASLIKTIQLRENSSFQLRMDAFNALNKTNFYASQLQDINSVSFGKLLNEWGPREVQISARFNF